MNNTIAKQKRAAKGGEYGANGKWYEGGKFINTVEENGKQKKKWKKQTRRRQVAPCVWEMQPDSDLMPIYGMLAGIEKFNRETEKFEFNEELTREFATAEAIEWRKERIARYNAGENWL